MPLVARAGNLLWDWPQRLEQVQVYLRNDSDEAQEMRLTVLRARRDPPWTTAEIYHRRGWNDLRDITFDTVAEQAFCVPGKFEGWYSLLFPEPLELGRKDAASDADRLLISLSENRDLWWGLSQAQAEICEMVEHSHHDTCWHALGTMGSMRLTPTVSLGEAANVINGYHRRFSRGPTNLWLSRTGDALPQEITFTWERPVCLGRVDLTFDNMTARRADNPWESGKRVLPMLVRAYDLFARVEGEWVHLAGEEENIHRFRVHRFPSVAAKQLRLCIRETHGAKQQARVYQVVARRGSWRTRGAVWPSEAGP